MSTSNWANIKSAEFIKGVTGEDDILFDGVPQVAFIGRSNVGKSSVINSLTNRRELAKSSSTAGRTKEVNFFLVNKDFYLVDLPGYGFAHGSLKERENIQKLIYWYLTHPDVVQKKVVLIVDAKVGVTESDTQMLKLLHEQGKNVIVVANKVDKLKKTESAKQLKAIEHEVSFYSVIPYSAEKKLGVAQLAAEIAK
jgi:GTP-binding protein